MQIKMKKIIHQTYLKKISILKFRKPILAKAMLPPRNHLNAQFVVKAFPEHILWTNTLKEFMRERNRLNAIFAITNQDTKKIYKPILLQFMGRNDLNAPFVSINVYTHPGWKNTLIKYMRGKGSSSNVPIVMKNSKWRINCWNTSHLAMKEKSLMNVKFAIPDFHSKVSWQNTKRFRMTNLG